jgi:lysophospholipase L1-like esterase
MKEKLLLLSLILNLVLIGFSSYFIIKKGGLSFIKRKMGIGQGYSDNGFGPYYDQRKSLFELLPRDTSDIIFLGHSVMDGCEWAELFNDPRMKNRGINGETTEGVLKRLDPIVKVPPRKILLMTGANDIANKFPVTRILGNCQQILDSFKVNCPRTEVYLISVLPSGRDYDQEAIPVIRELNAGLEKLAQSNHYTYIDLYSLVKDEEGYFDTTLSNDGSHLMGAGYLKVKEKLKGYLD